MLAPTSRWLLLVTVVTALAACSGDEQGEPEHVPTPLPEYDGSRVALSTAPFCEQVVPGAVERAVGAKAKLTGYVTGDRIPLGTATDVAHENGCTWTGPAGDVARAWVFVPPVTVEQGRALVDAAVKTAGCQALPAARFGEPSGGRVCTTPAGVEVSWRGLFGDAWLTCSLVDGGAARLARDELVTRAGEWCVETAKAATAADDS